MELQDKHITEILNAKCNFVCAVDSLYKKLEYGEDIGCCADNLFLASKLISRLDCYCFSTINVNYSYSHSFNNVVLLSKGLIYEMYINDILTSSYEVMLMNSNTLSEVVTSLILSSSLMFTLDVTPFVTTKFTINGTCNYDKISIKCINNESLNIIFATETTGVCGCINCIKESDLPKLYEVLDSFIK